MEKLMKKILKRKNNIIENAGSKWAGIFYLENLLNVAWNKTQFW